MDWLTNEVKALMTSGLFGTITRTILRPENHWKAWLAQVFIGLAAAVFIGQIIGHLFIKVIGVDSDTAVYYAVGYVIGTSAERVIETAQNRFFKSIEDKKSQQP